MFALKYILYILTHALVLVICQFFIQEDNFILEAAHPSPLSANNGFFGCNHFSKTNNLLTSLGSDPIDWQLE